MSSLDDLTRLALELSPEDRAALAHQLLLSLETEPPDPDWEEAWAAEIARRSDEVHAGTATLLDWREAMESSRRKLAERRKQ